MAETHSDKGKKTMELMGTVPEDWGLTPIKWVYEMRLAPVLEDCETCDGRGSTYTYPDGKVFGGEEEVRKALKKPKSAYIGYLAIDDYKKKHDIEYRRCPSCPRKESRSWGPLDVGTGKVIVWKDVEVLVGYPQWVKGTLFDSRFHEAKYSRTGKAAGIDGGERVHSVCELCSKSIYGIWSNLIPVNGRGKDGKVHGMYVGEDCAKKFLGITLVLSKEQKQAMKKSVRKEYFVIERTDT
jgi:hypothetical protein